MVLLGIDRLQHHVVGGDGSDAGTGLGAGDRKLVNIAIELVSQVEKQLDRWIDRNIDK